MTSPHTGHWNGLPPSSGEPGGDHRTHLKVYKVEYLSQDQLFKEIKKLDISLLVHRQKIFSLKKHLYSYEEVKIIPQGLCQMCSDHNFIFNAETIKKMPAGSNGTMQVKTQAWFSISIIVVGFISGIHYCLIGLIRKRHDCITNSTRACQDGFISIPVLFPEKHLVISVW